MLWQLTSSPLKGNPVYVRLRSGKTQLPRTSVSASKALRFSLPKRTWKLFLEEQVFVGHIFELPCEFGVSASVQLPSALHRVPIAEAHT